MKTLSVMVVGPVLLGQTHYRLPGSHPFQESADTHPRPSPQVPGIIIPVGKWVDVEVVDDRHEAILKQDHFLKFRAPEPPPELPPEEVTPGPEQVADQAEPQADASTKGKKGKKG